MNATILFALLLVLNTRIPIATATSSCLATNSSVTTWTNTYFPAQNVQFTAAYDATPNQNSMDGVVGFSLNAATGYTSLAVITRFASTGMMDVRNASAYSADVAVPYTAGLTYHFRLLINPATKTYTVYVTPPGGAELKLATNYAFRSEQSTVSRLNEWSLHDDVGSQSVCNMTITSGSGSGSTVTPPTISTQPASQTITAGQTATFTVVAGGTAPLGYQWQKNGANISGATSASYTTPATTTADSGATFAVVVNNTAGTVTSTAAKLTVQANPTFSISGTISPTAGGSGATVTLSGASSATTTANGSGNYSFTGLANGSYTVTPSHSGYTFTLASLAETVNGANITGVNFTATANPTFSISGTISPTAGGSGATVTLSGAANASTTTDGSGNYTFTAMANGSYTVTPSNIGYTFAPPNQTVSVSGANATVVNFTAQVVVAPAAGSPVLFFSDVISGPATGNSDPTYSANGGAYVTLYGNFFGSTLAATNVALNGSNCLGIVSQPTAWLWYQKFTVQLHSGCSTGNFTVTNTNGTSNGIAFTVQSQNIYFASASGSDSSGSGSWTAPWKTLLHARNTAAAGSTIYAMNGSDATVDDGSGWSTTFLINNSGSASAPYQFVVYPGHKVTIGNAKESSAIRSGNHMPTDYWTFSGFQLIASEVNSQWGSNNWRWIGNDITCPNGNGEEGCFEPIESTYIYTYGNNFHNMGVTGASAEYHGVYLATDSSFQDFGWNEIGFSNGGRGLQTHSENNGSGTNGYGIWGINIHDNIIHDTGSDCIVGDTLSPNGVGVEPPQGPGGLSGPVTIYNNVFYNCGLKTPPESTGDWSGIELPGTTTDGPSPSGTIYVFNNTFYAFGLNTSPPYGSSEYGVTFNGGGGSLSAIATNNIVYSTRGTAVPYFGGGSGFSGTNNWMFGGPSISGASGVTGTIGTDPGLTSVTSFNFLPKTGSPVIGAGKPITGVTPFGFNNIGRDINGNRRPSTPSIGAYE